MNKIYSIILFAIFCLLTPKTGNSQILISLLLGDKLNSDKLEFGLDGGLNLLNMSNTSDGAMLTNWNLGFYFDFKLSERLFIHTGVIVKSKMGDGGIKPYSLNNVSLDSLFLTGTVDRFINYFNVPGLVRYRVIDYLHVEGGVQLGLRYTGFDVFSQTITNENDLEYKNDVKDNFKRLDVGGVVGLGYKLQKGKGMTLSTRYYYGFIDANNLSEGNQNNSAMYFNVSIPIGRAKAARKAEEKAKQNQE